MKMLPRRIGCVAFAALLSLAPCLMAADADTVLRDWMDAIAQQQLKRRAAAISAVRTAEQAEARKAMVRAKLMDLIGGLPDYTGPLNASVKGRIEHREYWIEKVVFESLPRLYITANLYLPKGAGRHPGVLLPLGHWWQGKPAVQTIAGNLAVKGFAVLAYDPLGQGERYQAYDARMGESLAGGSTTQHGMAGAQALLAGETLIRYAVWDAKRALDYLAGRPEVDSGRIGCTGCSGGGTLTTYISALDPRIKVAAPACYMNSFQTLFSRRVGDSEQNVPSLLASGFDQTDFVELFAPKPWLINSTVDDFFTLEGARQVFHEARRWYGLYKATDRIDWAVGPGGHGTPVEIRERIYEWMIRWLKDGRGDATEVPVQQHPDHELWATKTGQVSTALDGRDLYAIILERLDSRRKSGAAPELRQELLRLTGASRTDAPTARILETRVESGLTLERAAFETEPGLELEAHLLVPPGAARKAAVLVVETGAAPSGLARRLAAKGAVVLSLAPRGLPLQRESRPLVGDSVSFYRALLIGRNLPGMRVHDILRGIDLLRARADVDPNRIAAVAGDVAGVWLLMAAALEPAISRVWLDRTPHSFRAAMEKPVHRNLHDAVLPGFLLRWDLQDIVDLAGESRVIRTDPANWTSSAVVPGGRFLYRTFDSGDERFLAELLR